MKKKLSEEEQLMRELDRFLWYDKACNVLSIVAPIIAGLAAVISIAALVLAIVHH